MISRIHVNAWFLALLLAALQAFVVYEAASNGGLLVKVLEAPVERVALLFSPTAGIVWSLKHFSRKDWDT